MKWIRGFMKRWPNLKCITPRNLEHARANIWSQTVVTKYFDELKQTLIENDVIDKPHLIFNIDEKGIGIDHNPPSIVADSAGILSTCRLW